MLLRMADEDHPFVMILPGDFAEAYVKNCRYCDFIVVGPEWSEVGYGVAFP